MTLDKAKIDIEYVVTKIDPKINHLNRLLEIGFIEGAIIKIVLTSPFKDIFIIDIDNYLLALQKDCFTLIEVEEYKCVPR